MSRFIFETLRGAREPVTSLELALGLIVSRHLDHRNQKLLRYTVKRASVTVRYQQDRDRIRSRPGPGRWLLWEIVHELDSKWNRHGVKNELTFRA